MIASVRGEVVDIALDHTVIEAGGVGYKVMATPSTLATLRRGTEARLITAMIVREDSQTLYGFADADARDLFLTLLGCPGSDRASHSVRWPCTTDQLCGQRSATATSALTRIPKVGRRLPSCWC